MRVPFTEQREPPQDEHSHTWGLVGGRVEGWTGGSTLKELLREHVCWQEVETNVCQIWGKGLGAKGLLQT